MVLAQSSNFASVYEYRGDEELLFTYPLLNEILPQCRCIVGVEAWKSNLIFRQRTLYGHSGTRNVVST